MHNAVTWIREECERIGRDPATMRIVAPMVSTPEMDEDEARAYLHARMVTYIGQPGMLDVYRKLNGWDPQLAQPAREHELFADDPDRVDHRFHRADLLEVAKLVPDEWVYETSITGSIEACVATMQAYKDAGADEISTPRKLCPCAKCRHAEYLAAWHSIRARWTRSSSRCRIRPAVP